MTVQKASATATATAGRNIIIFTLLLALFAGGAWMYMSHEGPKDYDSGLAIETAVIEMQDGKTHKFDLEIAAKPMDIEIGLMHRKYMSKDRGMLFQMGTPMREIRFWMKNTLISLDMLFVDTDGKIVNIHHKAIPESLTSIPSKFPVKAVIELNGGRAEEVGIRIGDYVRHSYFKTDASE